VPLLNAVFQVKGLGFFAKRAFEVPARAQSYGSYGHKRKKRVIEFLAAVIAFHMGQHVASSNLDNYK